MIRNIIICSLLMGIGFITNCQRMEMNEKYYEDYKTAMRTGEVSRGWMPDYIPTSATDIRLIYNIDTNQVWLAFHFNSSDLGKLLHSCEEVRQHEINYPLNSPDWWPKGLRTVSVNHKTESPFIFLKCNNGGTIAITDTKSKAYYWYLGTD